MTFSPRYLDEENVCFIIDNISHAASDVVINYGGLIVRKTQLKEVLRTRTAGQHPATDFKLYRRLTPACGMK